MPLLPEASPRRFDWTRLGNEILVAGICLVVYWWPMFIGGDYTRGDFEWNLDRSIALGVLAACIGTGLIVVRLRRIKRAVFAPVLVAASAGLVAFGGSVAAAWVHVPPFLVLWVTAGVAAYPVFVPLRQQGATAVVCAGLASFLVTFWMATFHPYL